MSNLSITEEQVKAFEEWQTEYVERIEFAEEVLRTQIGEKKYEESKAYKMLEEMKQHAETMYFKDGDTYIFRCGITSDMEFGYKFMKYLNEFRNIIARYFKKLTPNAVFFLRSAETKLPEIFNLK